jgi:creatinine amidohydrolase
MSPLWSATADPSTAWACQTWSDLAARPDKSRTLVVLPVHGFADHGMGLPLDAEESLGTTLLSAALATGGTAGQILVLPPFHFGTSPYAHSRFGVDAETVLDALGEILASLKSSGFTRILFFNTSPWNTELVSTAALDARTTHDLRTYVVSSAGLGLGFHPADPNRRRTQAVVAKLLGQSPSPSVTPPDVRDTDFRPGFFNQPEPVQPDTAIDGEKHFTAAATQLADLLVEIAAHEASAPVTRTPAVAPVFYPSAPARPRELVSLTAEQLAALPDKDRALVIIPAGAIEQHGHHLPLGTDAILVRLWLRHTLPKLPADSPVYVAPAITYGKSNEHLGFAGTLTISARTLRRQLLALATDLKALGFRQIAVLNTHGGNSSVIVATLREIQTTLGLRAGMLRRHYQPVQSPQEAAFGFHAGEWETSLMLAGAPGLVRMDRAMCEYPARLDAPGALRPEGSAAVFAWKTSDLSQSGVMGDATLATAEKGDRWLDEASTALAAKISSLLTSAIT